jgi:uncharacterized protein (UPF0333 family)
VQDGFRNQKGMGLIAAIFVVVVVGMFGSLIARYASVSSLSSAEDFASAQALYSAQSAAMVKILFNDGGGGGVHNLTNVAGFSVSATDITSGVQANAEKQIEKTKVHREIVLRVVL